MRLDIKKPLCFEWFFGFYIPQSQETFAESACKLCAAGDITNFAQRGFKNPSNVCFGLTLLYKKTTLFRVVFWFN